MSPFARVRTFTQLASRWPFPRLDSSLVLSQITVSPPDRRLLESPANLPAIEQDAGRRLGLPNYKGWLAAVALSLALWLYMAWAFRGQPGDDPYITYRYASNLAAGNGFVFNPGERVQSTTTPLFTLVLAAGGLLGLDIPALGYVLSLLCLLAFAVCCVGLVSSVRGHAPWLGIATAALTFLCPVTTYGLGIEMPLLMALSWGSWWAAARQNWLPAALLAGLAAVTRGDGVLVGLAIAIYFVATHLKTSLRLWPWGAILLYALVIAPWYILAWLYFGSPLPATLGAKLSQGNTPGTVSFFDGIGYFWVRSFSSNAWLWVPALVLLTIGLAAIIRGRSALLLPLLWAALFISGFSLLHVPRYPWYYSPLVPVAMLLVVMGGSVAGDFLVKYVWRALPSSSAKLAGVMATCLLVGGAYLANDIQNQRPEPAPRSQLYTEAGRWLAANTPPGASVGAEEVGFLGYFSQRRIVDFVGLIQPDVAPHRATGDNLWAVQTYKPDYILAMPAWMASAGANPWVRQHYTTLRTFELPGSDTATLLKLTP